MIEVPYVFKGRTVGESKMNLKEATGYLRQLRDLHAYRRGRHLSRPTHRVIPRGQVCSRVQLGVRSEDQSREVTRSPRGRHFRPDPGRHLPRPAHRAERI